METKSAISVVIVEDNSFFSSMIKMFIDERFETNAVVYNTGEEMFANMFEAPDIVFLDYNLDTKKSKKLNGKVILEMLKKKYPNTLVVMLSSQNNISVAVDLLKSGACDYIVKNEEAIKNVESCLENLVYLLEARNQKLVNNAIVKKDLFRVVTFGLAFTIILISFVKFF